MSVTESEDDWEKEDWENELKVPVFVDNDEFVETQYQLNKTKN